MLIIFYGSWDSSDACRGFVIMHRFLVLARFIREQVLFVIATPDVYKSPNSDCYIVFGEAKIEDQNSQAAQLANAQALAQSAAGAHNHPHDDHDHPGHDHSHDANDDKDSVPELEEVDDAALDESGVDPKDIELVMAQVGCGRSKAVRVLKENNGDLITASTCSFVSDGKEKELTGSLAVMAANE